MESKKRKREDEKTTTVVTFSAPHNRTFDRVLRDQSFSEVKGLVRKKLGLSKREKLSLVQLRDGKEVDLEDEDDYEAFRALSRTSPSLQVQVRLGDVRHNLREDPAPELQSLQSTLVHQRNLQASQPIAGPSTATLDAVVPAEHNISVDTPPRKKQKADGSRMDRAQSVAESVLTDASVKRRKKHRTRVPSSGSAADLSASIPESPGPTLFSGKNPGPLAVGSTGPSCALPPQPAPLDRQLATKSKQKRKAAGKTIDASSTLPVGTPEPAATPVESKKRDTADIDPVEEPQPKKAKKKAKEQSALVDTPTSPAPSLHPPQPTEERARKEKKKSKKATENDLSSSQQTAEPAALAEPTPTAAGRKGKGKKNSGVIEGTKAASAVTGHEATQFAEADGLQKKKGSKSAKEDQPTAASSSQGVPRNMSVPTMNKGASISATRANGSEEIDVESKKPAKVRKDKPKGIVLDDSDFMAAVNAVLFKSSSKASESTPVVSTSTAAVVPNASLQHSQGKSKANKEYSKTARKSRLSTTWGPADITEESTSDPSTKAATVVPILQDSVSATVSNPRFSSVRRPPRPPAAIKSPVPTQTDTRSAQKLDASFSISRANSPERPSSVIPVGSEISELIVQGKDEGSSNESEDSDEEPLEKVTAPSAIPPISRSLSKYASSQPNSAAVSEMDVEALLRGPVPTRSILSLIPFESSSEDEKSESEALASEEEEREERAYRRMSKRFEAQASSSDEEPVEDEPAIAENAEPLPSPRAGSESSDVVVDEPIPVESSVPVAAEATNNKPLRTSLSSIDVKSDEETKTPIEHAQSEKAPAELAESGSELEGRPGKPSSSSSRADMAEVENIVPTSDPAEAEDDANNSDDLKLKEDASDVQSTGNRELSQEVPFTEEVYAAKDDDERTREDADHGEENEEPAAAGSSEVETDFEPDFEQLVPDSAGLRSRSDSREDPTDPIQPAEGLALALDRASNDPIEFDPPVVESDNEEVEVPVPSPRPGTAKRMKDRNGRVPASDVLPALSSQPRLARQPRSARNSSNASADDATSGSTPESHEELVSIATEPRRSTRQASVQPPPAEALPPASAPKRRGRPPASAEEKARKAAEKEAEKQRRAAEREAKKQKAAEDKARKAAAKGKNAPAKKGAVAAKTVSADTIPAEASEAVATPPPPPTTAVPNLSALSVAKWTSLAETAQTQDAEMSSMVDELRSSSPELASPNIPPAGVAIKDRNVEPIDVSMKQGEEDEKDSDDESPTVKASSGARPLFIPGDSQHPLADSRSYLLSSPQMPSQPSQLQSQDRFKRPLAPVTSWAKQSKYRRLSDIKSQDMFSPLSKLPVPGRRPQTAQTAQTAEERRASMYGDVGADSNSEDDSDSDDENASHIPKNRRAGVHKKELFVE